MLCLGFAQTQQGAPRPLHLRKGHRPLTRFRALPSPFPYNFRVMRFALFSFPGSCVIIKIGVLHPPIISNKE